MRGGAAPLALGIAWAILMALLAAGGHRPSAAHGLPVSADRYYGVAALYLAPLCVALWWWLSAVTHRAARRLGGSGDAATLRAALGPAWALSLLLGLVLPDLAVYLAAGHAALASALPYYAPVAVTACAVACARATARVTGLRGGRAFAAAAVGLLAHAVPAALLIR